MSDYRYEKKYIISKQVADILKIQLSSIMELDPHSLNKDVSYEIRSLYFDDLDHSAYYEKVDGIEYRKKYRMRMYNMDTSTIKLECKYKDENMTRKQSCALNQNIARLVLKEDYNKIKLKNDFFKQFKDDTKLRNLKPSVIVDYSRLAYVYPISEVRITFDMKLKSSAYNLDFFTKEIGRIDCFNQNEVVLEVKFNEFLPDFIQVILNQYNLNLGAISKFALCDEYKWG